ncbi:MAG: energy-coupling factor transporter ATPase [Oscillospiraceae bacterium]|nr:energy-coupling factor transporter ATPase [Oscillospiraceae bacterium]
MTPILKTEQLSYVYGAGTPFEHRAVDRIDLEVAPGEFLGIIGHTGSGKSTLIQHLNGLLRPTEGRVFFEDRDLWRDPKQIRQTRFRVGLVFQYPEYQLFEETVARDIAFGPRNMGLAEEDVARRVQAAMQLVGLAPETADKSPFDLSGGQKRRVAIAGVMAMEPDVLILDEPTAGLDPRGREDILGHIRTYHTEHGSAVILVSHSMEEIARSVQRIVVLSHARVVMDGTPHEVFSRADELEQTGLSVPAVTQVMRRLRALGLDIDPAAYTVRQAASELAPLIRRVRLC